MTSGQAPIGPLDCEIAVERKLALPALAVWLSNGTISFATTHPRFAYLAGTKVVSTVRVVGLARPYFDRVDPDGGSAPVFSRHDHYDGYPCVLLPGTVNLCTACLADIWLLTQPPIDESLTEGLAALIVAAAVEGFPPVVTVELDDLQAAMLRETSGP